MIRRQPRSDAVAVTFILPASHPNAPVSVVGDFNEWQPSRHPMIKRPDGSLSTTILFSAGSTVHFRYLGCDGVWFDDPDADSIDNQGGFIRV
ncbi:isoamylase early set domain-containing protein [Propionimicrobium sp. PCR01-08-3]|uniref:isoamylase early set domain-containing protein n=1 Tax=Propionimicrobium sp. PCR01-08-3 TaxID=3052086 RepID=UPI00255C747B|nr:isoamylase early set domain-containing protein [Propionimicrobium sp. PCR01-08-3]WIY82491.1 isoamylase early set domain-containing protein [Propionimicrobium sp. PCR01-08-3]